MQYGADLKKDSITFQEISSATRSYRPILSTFDVAKKYWETIALVGPDGQGSVDLRVFCLAEVNTSEVVKARKAFITQANGNPEVKQILKDIGQKQRDKVLNSKKPADDTEAKD